MLIFTLTDETGISSCISSSCAMQFSSHKMTTLNLYKFIVHFKWLPMQSVKTVVLLPMILNNIGAFAKVEKSKKETLKNNHLWMADNVILVQKYVILVTDTIFKFIRSSFPVGLSPIQMSLGILLYKLEIGQTNSTLLTHHTLFYKNYSFFFFRIYFYIHWYCLHVCLCEDTISSGTGVTVMSCYVGTGD